MIKLKENLAWSSILEISQWSNQKRIRISHWFWYFLRWSKQKSIWSKKGGL